MKNNLKKLIVISTLVLIPYSVFSAQLTAKHLINSNGNKNSVEVYLDTEGETINTIEGSVILDGFTKDIIAISTGESLLPLWPNKPSLVESKLSFTGGIPKGINGKSILLFIINLKPSTKDELRILPKDLYVYLNNGNGDSIKVNDRTIFMVKGDTYLESTIPNDTTVPVSFNIDIGKDTNAYEGKYFISFFTTDKESGINHYEVKEGDSDPVLADSPYVLRDQTLNSVVYIIAYDNAGNSKVEKYTPMYKLPMKIKFSIILILSLLLIGAFRNFWIKIIKNKNR